jgi:hypothetical protein
MFPVAENSFHFALCVDTPHLHGSEISVEIVMIQIKNCYVTTARSMHTLQLCT